jgi:hypothetical protein
MKIKEWEKQREKDREKGSYKMNATDPIQICMEDKEIRQLIKEYNLTEIKEDLWLIHLELSGDLYLNKLENTPKAIRSWLFEKNAELKNMFPKYFWAEYIANTAYERNYTFEDMVNYCGIMNDIYDFLWKNKKYQKYTGEQYQESKLHDIIEKRFGMTFGWRSWGALMAAFMNTKEKERKYTYMSYYMR